MKIEMQHCFLTLLVLLYNSLWVGGQNLDKVVLENGVLKLVWSRDEEGFVIKELTVASGKNQYSFPGTLGSYTILYAADKPSDAPQAIINAKGEPVKFPEPEYHYMKGRWKDNTTTVALNRAGREFIFFPASFRKKHNAIYFSSSNNICVTEAVWQLDPEYKNDVCVTVEIKALKAGFFSIATPTLVSGNPGKFDWAAIPGIFQGRTINHNFIDAFAYGHGVPDIPVVVRERTAAALTSILTNEAGKTLAVTAEPGTGRDPWLYDSDTHKEWLLGLSAMNRQGKLMPTLYHPVLGQKHSYLKEGDSIVFRFRYTIKEDDWYNVYKHVVRDIYRFNDFLALKQTRESLSIRLERLFQYVRDDSTSKWRTFDYHNREIGAQEYLGGEFAKKGAVKNADYGAMWMMAGITGDSVLQKERLPYALNFKLTQQNLKDGFFKGAAAGQYYLYKSKRFTEEWGDYTEPMATTYYLLLDIGNILLFEPENQELKDALYNGANWLLSKMHHDGRWEIAYKNDTHEPLFKDEYDYRPTFYGLLVAYKILKDKKFLEGAIKGANWFVEHAVNNGYYLGVCGDTRFVPDFATGQSAQALLDLYKITGMEKYRKAALSVAQIYTTSIYSHPIPASGLKKVGNKSVHDWEVSQVGLSFEHGGTHGSANYSGPILLSSHAGMFVRIYQLTGDSLYLNMARAAAWGRDAFVDSTTGVASYYWRAMNNGAGPYPHHAWWQIGWIMDYLIAEANMRSMKKITFPSGFITPKVGPHLTYGFAKGSVMGNGAVLILRPGLLRLSNPKLDCLTALNEEGRKLYLVILNNSVEKETAILDLDMDALLPGNIVRAVSIRDITVKGKESTFRDKTIRMDPTGLRVLEVSYD